MSVRFHWTTLILYCVFLCDYRVSSKYHHMFKVKRNDTNSGGSNSGASDINSGSRGTDPSLSDEDYPLHEHPHDYYYTFRGIARKVLDLDTIKSLGFDPKHLKEFARFEDIPYEIGPDIPHIKAYQFDYQDAVGLAALSNVINGQFVHRIEYLGEYINPSICLWKGRILMATGLEWGFLGSQRKPASGHIEFRWVNNADYKFDIDNTVFLGIRDEIEELGSVESNGAIQSRKDNVIVGQDPRLLLTERDTVLVLHTNMAGRFIRMGMTEIGITMDSSSSSSIDAMSTARARVVRRYITIQPSHEFFRFSHKNWSPFLYKNDLMLIQSVNPLMVLRVPEFLGNASNSFVADAAVEIVSRVPSVRLKWDYGELRGGTNAVFIRGDVAGSANSDNSNNNTSSSSNWNIGIGNKNSDRYLSFFHTVVYLPGNMFRTYLMGAYTFTAAPPFRLTGISPMPIVPARFYSGPLDPLTNRHIDYCMFPMSFFIENDKTIRLSVGSQDHAGYMMQMDLQALLSSLVQINSAPPPPPQSIDESTESALQ